MTQDEELGLGTFFRSVFAFLGDRLKGKVSPEEIQHQAQSVIGALGTQPKLGTWEDSTPLRVEQAKRKEWIGKTVRVFGHIAKLNDPQLVHVHLPDDAFSAYGYADDQRLGVILGVDPTDEEATSFCLRDSDGSTMWSLEVLGPTLITKLQDARRRGLPVEFLGVPIPVPTRPELRRPDAKLRAGRQDIVLHLLDLRPATSPLHMLGASLSERADAEAARSALLRRGECPLVHIQSALIDGLGLVATGEFVLLRDLIEFTVLQALAVGRITHASGRLHLLLIGPPGQGKKLVGVAARLLNPACSELSASKVSAAGLVGASHQADGGWVSTPGLLPRAAHGVALLQDAHGWSEAVVRQVGPVLQEVIEDGIVRSAVAGGGEHPTPVGLILDANRAGHLGDPGPSRAEAPILRLRPLLSRVDVIAEIPDDPDRSWNVARQMYERLRTHQDGSSDPSWARGLKLLVATLRERHPEIDLSAVRGAMAEVHAKLHADNREALARMAQAGDVPTRLAISFARLVAASSRAHDRGSAREDDVAVALKFVNMKLDYLKLHGATRPSSSPSEGTRQAWLLRQRTRGSVSASELAARYEKEHGQVISARTMRRELSALGAVRRGKGEWLLPGGEE